MQQHPGFDVDEEYESVCGYMATRGRTGQAGDALPMGLSRECHDLIECNPECFRRRIRDYAYAMAMERSTVQP